MQLTHGMCKMNVYLQSSAVFLKTPLAAESANKQFS